MFNLKELENLRTKEELIGYFKAMDKNITEEEIEALKQSYEKAKGNENTLTLQQLDEVAAGMKLFIVRDPMLRSVEEHLELAKNVNLNYQTLKDGMKAFLENDGKENLTIFVFLDGNTFNNFITSKTKSDFSFEVKKENFETLLPCNQNTISATLTKMPDANERKNVMSSLIPWLSYLKDLKDLKDENSIGKVCAEIIELSKKPEMGNLIHGERTSADDTFIQYIEEKFEVPPVAESENVVEEVVSACNGFLSRLVNSITNFFHQGGGNSSTKGCGFDISGDAPLTTSLPNSTAFSDTEEDKFVDKYSGESIMSSILGIGTCIALGSAITATAVCLTPNNNDNQK